MVMIIWNILTGVLVAAVLSNMERMLGIILLLAIIMTIYAKIKKSKVYKFTKVFFSTIVVIVQEMISLVIGIIKLVKKVFTITKQFCKKRGITETKSNIIATIVLIIIIAIII